MMYVIYFILAIMFILIIISIYELIKNDNNQIIKNLNNYAEKEKIKQLKSKIQNTSRVGNKAYKKKKVNLRA